MAFGLKACDRIGGDTSLLRRSRERQSQSKLNLNSHRELKGSKIQTPYHTIRSCLGKKMSLVKALFKEATATVFLTFKYQTQLGS